MIEGRILIFLFQQKKSVNSAFIGAIEHISFSLINITLILVWLQKYQTIKERYHTVKNVVTQMSHGLQHYQVKRL